MREFTPEITNYWVRARRQKLRFVRAPAHFVEVKQANFPYTQLIPFKPLGMYF
jgi:hypothetical protein